MNIVGKKIKIIGKHPHSGEIGTVESVEKTFLGSVGWKIKLENCSHGTNGCFVFKSENIKLLN